MATSEMSPIFCVRGTIPPPRPRPRKVTNSEKTSTTNNLSQHKYLKLKRQMQHETDNTLIATGDKQIINRDQPLRKVVNAQDYRKQKCASNVSASHSMQHQYKLVSDFDSQWHSLYHHFTTYQQHRHPPSAAGLYQGSARTEGTSHLKGSSDLPKLLTSTRLSPRVPPNQQNTASCNYYSQHPSPHINSSATSANFYNQGASSNEDPLCYDHAVDIAPDNNYDSCSNDNCMSHCLPIAYTDPLIMSTVYMSSAGGAASTMTSDTRKTSWYNEYLRSSLQRMHARTRNERKKTKSAPGGSVSLLAKGSKQRTELFTSATVTYFSQRDVPERPPRELGVHVDFDALKAEKVKEVLGKPPPLYKPIPKPRSHWYEMKTPDFHREAKRNNILIRKSCNW